MKELLPIIAAGSAFAAAALVGLVAGILVGQRTGQPLYAFLGLLAGLGIGAYSAIRMLMRTR